MWLHIVEKMSVSCWERHRESWQCQLCKSYTVYTTLSDEKHNLPKHTACRSPLLHLPSL